MFSCLHFVINSDLLFKSDGLFDCKIHIFSAKHRLHLDGLPLYALARFMILHFNWYSMLLDFNSQRCLLNVVLLASFWCLKDDLCTLYLVLNSFSVMPMYVFLSPVACITVASYTTVLVLQSPFSGHKTFCLQLHLFVALFWVLRILRLSFL